MPDVPIETAKRGVGTLVRIKVKLNSKADRFKSHKLFGIPCLLSYLFHLLQFFRNGIFHNNWSFGFENYPFYVTLLIITWHCLLPISSLQFKHILAERKRKFPVMIWKEMRLQQIAFTLRQYLVAAISLYCSSMEKDSMKVNLIKYAAIVFCHILADLASKFYGNGLTTVRSNYADKFEEQKWGVNKIAKYYFAFMQNLGTATIIGPHLDWISGVNAGFGYLYGLHLAAFGMTLRKTGFISTIQWLIWYATWLVFAGIFCAASTTKYHLIGCVIASILRFRFRMNKYILWTCFFITVSFWTNQQ